MTPEELKANVKRFTELRKEASDYKSLLKNINEEIDEITIEVSAHMKMFGIGNLETEDGGKVGTTTNYYPSIQDLDAFSHWATHEGQEWVNENFADWKEKYGIGDTIKSTVLNTTANRSVALAMLKHFRDVAEEEGVEITSLLPPGLEYSAKTNLTYRRPTAKQAASKKKKEEIQGAVDMIRRQIGGSIDER